MSAEGNKAIIRRFVEEVQNGGDLTVLDEIAAPDYVNHSAPPGVPADREGLKQLTAMFRRAFPDGRMAIEDLVAEGDRVAARYTERGTFAGPFRGKEPTGKSYELTAMEWFALQDGRIHRRWGARDSASQARQVGM
jgi:steroid delta-isomerase-like uncharacterized protein